MYKKVSTDMNFVEREKEVLSYWKEKDVFKKSIENRKDGETFTFYDGPPTANGKPHIGHILTRVIKDIIPRYKTMKGYKVLRKAGWDTHGLPVELEVEKLLGIDGKPEIEKYGVEPFIKKCKESVWKYKQEWENMSDRVGFWADMDDPYITYDDNYIESIWWALKQIWDKGLIYKGHKIVPYCPRCGTSLSSHEVAQGYKDVKETSLIAKFRVKGKENEYILAWTTTPWTLPSNVALCVNPKEEYVKVQVEDEKYILAKALVEKVITKEATILESYVGKDLYKLQYEPLFDFSKEKNAYFVVCDNYVTLTDGTGIVHIAPAFGEDDAKVGRAENLPFVQLVDEQGLFKEEAKGLKGVFAKEADPMIIKDLDERGLLFSTIEFEHSYPFCWRCDTALLYYARSTWFIETTKVKEDLIKNNQLINWYPDNIKNGRFGNFLDNNIDWSLSRERYWGTPLPIWVCECGHRHMIGSKEELYEKGINVPKDIELHKPYIDQVKLVCDKCQKEMTRVTEVIDCWFDSGSMPFAQWHYPFENKEIFEDNFPANFISEALDQTRGWFYTLHAISTLVFNKPAYENVVVLGLVQDKDGLKMSKHKGNVVDPWTVLDKQGADAVRWYFYTASAPWLPSRFYEEAVSEGQRKFMGTLWNTYAFYVLYAEIDKFNPYEYQLDYDKLPVIDKWVLTKLNSLIKHVDDNLMKYRITEAAREIQSFVDELSNWYVRRNRERFWIKDMVDEKINAYLTLHTVLVELSKLVAPFVPFMAENIYQNLAYGLNNSLPNSVHMCDFPTYYSSRENDALIENMDLVMDMVVAGRTIRNTAAVKNRQPIGTMYVSSEKLLDASFVPLVKDELNVKELVFTDDIDSFTSYAYKPQLRTVGPKYGKILGKIKEHLNEADGDLIKKHLINDGKYVFFIDGNDVELFVDDLLESEVQKDGFYSEKSGDIVVVLDTNLTEELLEEGFVREIISKVQTMRKDAGFEVQDNIRFAYKDNEKIKDIIVKNEQLIMDEILATEIIEGSLEFYEKNWKVNGESVVFFVEKA